MTRLDEMVRGDTAGVDEHTDREMQQTDGRWDVCGLALTSSWGVCHRFGGLLGRFCQCISFSWFVYVPSLSCVHKSRPKGAPPERKAAKFGR